jgi:hypothetical protein
MKMSAEDISEWHTDVACGATATHMKAQPLRFLEPLLRLIPERPEANEEAEESERQLK